MRVDNRPPVEMHSVIIFKRWASLHGRLERLELGLELQPKTRDLRDRNIALGALVSSVEAAGTAARLADSLALKATVDRTGLSRSADVRKLVAHLQDTRIVAEFHSAQHELSALTSHAGERTQNWQILLDEAVRTRSPEGFAKLEARLRELRVASGEWALAHDRLQALRAHAPKTAAAIEAGEQFAGQSFEAAWHHARIRAALEAAGIAEVDKSVRAIEQQIEGQLGALAHTRAWKHAIRRMTDGTTRADLTAYSQLTRKVGKGTGKHAEKFTGKARRALQTVRPSIPAWIMPLYRVWEQVEAKRNLFDVIVIDEASQAGLEAVGLQLLAPHIVVIGDDLQVSPSNVGINEQELSALARRYLPQGNIYFDGWEIAERSLFDEAKLRYSDVITLLEHRRCAPPIIEFSNKIAYEPANIRLLPTRQRGRDSLAPMQTTFVPTGYRSANINVPEAEALVGEIAACLANPAYDDKTFGVITLMGAKQHKAIEHLLLDKLPPEVWQERDLRVGQPASFQGSERNVIFASLVVDAGGRTSAQTGTAAIQRFNVAVSRAQDQFWLFHSLTAADISNPECLRRRLIDHCTDTERSQAAGFPSEYTSLVSSNERVDPFDSLFEQRVFNELVSRGYVVEPQHPQLGYQIDLVVHGFDQKLAVECDGEHWHGPDRYVADMRRQRSLEGCGWVFHRIRESEFYADRKTAIGALVERLEEQNIKPGAADYRPATEVDTVGSPLTAPVDAAPATVLQYPSSGIVPEMSGGPEIAESPSGVVQSETILHVEPQTEPSLAPVDEAAQTEVAPVIDEDSPGSEFPTTTESSALLGHAFAPYIEWVERPIAEATQIPRPELSRLVVEFVEAEGPVAVDRLYQVINKASGRTRTSRAIRRAIDAAIALEDGRKLLGVRGSDGEYAGGWLRTVDQPEVSLREAGPRSLDEIPQPELVEALRVSRQGRHVEPETLFRAVMDEYGMNRLTENRRGLFEAALGVLEEENGH